MKRHVETPSDATQRLEAIDPTRSFIVQAPAGSGKTSLLTQRYLALLSVAEAPDEVLAITFTRKAAQEMRERILEAMAEAQNSPEAAEPYRRATLDLAGKALERDRQRGWNLLENPAQLQVQTIDSLNARLVGQMPWISRMGRLPQVADDPSRLYRLAAERVVERSAGAKTGREGVERLLRHLDNRASLLRDLLVAMLARRDQWLRHFVGNQGRLDRNGLEGAISTALCTCLDRLNRLFPQELREEAATLARYAGENLAASTERPLAALAGMDAFPEARLEDLLLWRGLAELFLTRQGRWRARLDKNCGFPAGRTGPTAANKEAMRALLGALEGMDELRVALEAVTALPDPGYGIDQWAILESLSELLPLAVAELWLIFRQENRVDFAEIAMRAHHALGTADEPSELLLRLDTRIRHILVDEFQDTSLMQFSLVQHLTSGWQPSDGRTLFLVGDPMQSIYRFREAEVGLFLKARTEGIGQVPLTPLRLTSNFRSQAGIVQWVNATFGEVFPKEEETTLGAVPYATAVAALPLTTPEAVTIHPLCGRDDATEARLVADLAGRCLEGSPDETVAVLVRSRGHLAAILPELRRAGLRYLTQDIDPLAQRPVARDIVALTRALLHPGDRLAWLTVLRAPWCGLTLTDLHALGGLDLGLLVCTCLLDQERLARLSADGQKRAGRAMAILGKSMETRGRVPLRKLVEGCWLALGGPVCTDATGVADAETVFSLLEALDCGGDLRSFSELDAGVQRLYAAPDSKGTARLQIMTIHKAKGLEFDHVILPGLGRRKPPADKPLLRWIEHPDWGLLLAPLSPPGDRQSKDLIYEMIGRIDRDKESHEAARLLYVAATRPKKCLHLLGHVAITSDGEPKPESGSLLESLWSVVKGSFPVSAQPKTTGQGGDVATQATLRRLPVDWVLPRPNQTLPPSTGTPLRPSAMVERTEKFRANAMEGGQILARHVGTAIHLLLERIATEGIDLWRRDKQDLLAVSTRCLVELGTPSSLLEEGAGTVMTAIITALESSRGQWILGPHAEAACEFEVSGGVGGRLVRAVIDRTFVDESGVRWIIDYKTGEKAQGADERDLDGYRLQLGLYARLLGGLYPEEELRGAIYQPLLDRWQEIDLSEDVGQLRESGH